MLQSPGMASIETVPEPVAGDGDILLKVRMVGFCGSDLNSFRGLNPLVSFPRIPGHEVCATVVQGDSIFLLGPMSLSFPTQAAVNAHRAGGDVRMPASSTRLLACRGTVLSLNSSSCHQRSCFRQGLRPKELCFVEPLTVGFHAVARGRVTADDIVAVLGCGGVGLGAIAGSNCRGARTICVDVDDEKLESRTRLGGAHTINSAVNPYTSGYWS